MVLIFRVFLAFLPKLLQLTLIFTLEHPVNSLRELAEKITSQKTYYSQGVHFCQIRPEKS